MRCKYCKTPLQWDSMRLVCENTGKVRGVRSAMYCPNDECTIKPCTDYYTAPSSSIREAHHFAIEEDRFMDEY